MAALTRDSIIAVVGCGAMGAGIAQVAAAAGHVVKLYDARPDALNKAIDDIAGTFGKLSAKGKMSVADAEAARGRLHAVATMAELGDAALVIEAIVEDLGAKRALFAELEGIIADDAILATNTSSISVTAIAAPLRRPERLVGMHFFNPVPLMALVEIVSGLATGHAAAQTVHDTAAAWGKNPVHTKSTPGFIVNRVARPYYAEAWRLLGEGAGDTATLDALMREAGGFRMGPFELMDLIGHDVNYAVTKSVFDAYYGDPRFTPSVLQREMVDAGFLGRKSGRGFYRYAENAVPQPAKSEPNCPRPEYVGYSLEAGASGALTAPMLARLEAHGLHVTRRTSAEGHQHGEAPAFHCNGAAIYLTDGRTATARARANRHDDTVVFDLVLDAAHATRIAIARADQCGEAAYQAAVALFQAAGFTVTRLDDVPGLAVMRTVAMLANEAADTVYHGVCSAQAVDMAMQKGVNYPKGPLAWAEAVGTDHVVKVLDNLAATYGDGRYRVSPLLRRRQAGRKALHAE
ncbi:3-hydroxyacyl-CoA dehydrogenase PaaH [Pseudoduganella lutea]|uniref:3-hydroxyacyl-CoA dehydrogenase PaaC n=1 Tax=Pseudoduganella lutea TaxID=321985 RepID=A0A4P6L7D6_9BURK|nr:3-hydroxyacyl-CoA dehydrogenase PaaH [Pseudoduganella lutea]QBE67315.1 3-hydroxyacyl-CoA dehydrogenase PaaC [Pseudoduganella lutea]